MTSSPQEPDIIRPSEDPAGWTIDKVFGRRVKALRLYHNLTQKQLAERMAQQGFPMSQSTVADIEGGGRGVRLQQAVVFARFFGVPLDDLLYDIPAENTSQAQYGKLVEAQELEQQARRELDAAERAVSQARAKHLEALKRVTNIRQHYLRTKLSPGEPS